MRYFIVHNMKLLEFDSWQSANQYLEACIREGASFSLYSVEGAELDKIPVQSATNHFGDPNQLVMEELKGGEVKNG